MNTEARKTRTILAVATAVLTCAVAVPVATSSTAASTSGPKPARVLKLVSRTIRFMPIGFPADPNQAPPIGARYIVQLALFNRTAQFGKRAGARVGSVELDCTFATTEKNLCTGVAHVPDGFFTFTGVNPSNGAPTEWYAVTGGVSAYANLQGQIKATGSQNGNRSSLVVTLY
jgi:hypothetical protein